jgi:hypothetical protein
MDFFLIIGGVIQNVVVVDSLQHARDLFPAFEVIERTEENQHLNPGDVL